MKEKKEEIWKLIHQYDRGGFDIEEVVDEIFNVLITIKTDSNQFVPYQCCPICGGSGEVLSDGFTSAVYEQCDTCKGNKIIPMALIKNNAKSK